MKLVVSELRALRQYVSREFFHVLNGLIAERGWRQLDPYELWRAPGSLRDKLLRNLGELPTVVLFWEGYEFLAAHARAFERLGCRKYVFADDLHWRNEMMRAMKTLGFSYCDAILCTYEPAFHRFYPGLAREKEVVWVPHAASPDFQLELNEHPEDAVFLSGAIDRHYPLRQEMLRLYQKKNHSLVLHDHPGYHCGYDYDRDTNVGRHYAARIHRYLAGFTDSSRFRYTIAKYFEIPATGSLLLGDGAVGPALARLGLLEGVHYVSVSHADLEQRVAYVLDARHREEIDAIRRRGQELVRERHTTRHRTRQIDEICR